MRRRIWLGCLCCAVLRADQYTTSVKEIGAQDWRVDFTKLRFICASSSHCEPIVGAKLRNAFDRAMKDGQYGEAAKVAEKAVAQGVISIKAHRMCLEAYTKLGDTVRAELHERVIQDLRRSYGGDGTSREAAFIVLSIAEEYSLVEANDLLAPCGQTYFRDEHHRYDELSCKSQDKAAPVKIYFQIDHMPY